MARLTQADWKRLRQMLQPFKHFNGMPALLGKIEENIIEGDSAYIKLVRVEFVRNGTPPAGDPLAPAVALDPARVSELAPLADAEIVRRLMGLGCRVLEQSPPRYTIQVPHDGDEFDETIDVLETLEGTGRIRYLR